MQQQGRFPWRKVSLLGSKEVEGKEIAIGIYIFQFFRNSVSWSQQTGMPMTYCQSGANRIRRTWESAEMKCQVEVMCVPFTVN